MKLDDIKPGIRVRTHSVGKTTGMLVNPKNLAVRRDGELGKVLGRVAGHSGVWWVQHHPSGEVGAYMFHELETAEARPDFESDSLLD